MNKVIEFVSARQSIHSDARNHLECTCTPHDHDAISYCGKIRFNSAEMERVATMVKKSVIRRDIRPITSREDLNMILDMLVQEERYREALLIVMGVNFGLRYSDLSHLRYCDLINPDMTPIKQATIIEQKTGKPRLLLVNETVHRYLMLHLNNYTVGRGHLPMKPSFGDFIFMNSSNSRTKSETADEPLTHKSMERMIKKIMKDAGMVGNYNTHSLRKTFGRLYMEERGYDGTALYELQKLYGHSSPAITLLYIGLTPEELNRAYSQNYGAEALMTIESSNVLHSLSC